MARKGPRGKDPVSTPWSSVTKIPGANWQADGLRVKLQFTDSVIVTPAVSGVYTTQYYGVNTPRVPERSGSTGVAQGWGVYAAEYFRYVPLGSRIEWEVTAVNQAQAAVAVGDACMIKMACVPLSSDDSFPTEVQTQSVMKYAKWYTFPVSDYTGAVATGYESGNGNPRMRWKGRSSMTIAKMAGVNTLENATFAAVSSADPSWTGNWVFGWQDIIGTAHFKAQCIFNIKITYDVYFYSRIVRTNSLLIAEAQLAGEWHERQLAIEERKGLMRRVDYAEQAQDLLKEIRALGGETKLPVDVKQESKLAPDAAEFERWFKLKEEKKTLRVQSSKS